MKKIPTLFEREFANHRIVNIFPSVPSELAWVLDGEGVATIKWDGSCCAVIDGIFYRRYDAKHGKPVPCDRAAPGDKWFWEAFDRMGIVPDGTYEAIGPHFRANPHELDVDILKPHGQDLIDPERSFEGIRSYLETHMIEGIVFWKDGEPRCKIKRKDFGFPWPK